MMHSILGLGVGGGFEERYETNKCYKQERTAMLLSLFLGSFGADHFYAHQ